MKVNIGNDKHKKSFFPIVLDSSTTLNFGECVPVYCQEVVPQTHVKLNVRNAVRFAPLSFPTFGKAFLKTFSFCHKLSDLYPPFNDMLNQTPFTSGVGTEYIPQSVPSVPLWLLWLSVLSNADISLYNCNLSSFGKYQNDVLNGSNPFILSNNCTFELVEKVSFSEEPDYILSAEDICCSFPYWVLYSLYNGIGDISEITSKFDDVQDYLNYIRSNTTNAYDFIFFDRYASDLGNRFLSGDDNPNYPGPQVTFESADFIVPLAKDSIDGIIRYNRGSSVAPHFVSVSGMDTFETNASNDGLVACVRLNDSGKFLRKILMGLGYQLAPLNTPVSLLPIYAYFKSYFETFAPKRFIKFGQTYFNKYINYIVNTGNDAVDSILLRVEDSSPFESKPFGWNDIINDLLSCYYTKDSDYYSAQIIGLINDYGSDINQRYLGVTGNGGEVSTEYIESNVYNNVVPNLSFGSSTSNALTHTQSQQNILSRLTQFINRRSLAGGKIASVLKSVFGISQSDVIDESPYIGSSVLDVEIGDVFSTSETPEASLGEYAGKAFASSRGEIFNINTTTHSIVLSFSVIIPRTQYVQGVNPLLTHVNRSDFYNPMFDGLTLLPTRKSALYCGDSLFFNDDNKSSFGNIPIYSEYKTKSSGILSGDLSLRSTRATYDSFTLDEIISDSSNVVYDDDSNLKSGTYSYVGYDFNDIVCGTMWRYLGRWLWLGRFDRIFVNNRLSFSDFQDTLYPISVTRDISSTRNLVRTDDNLIVHSVVDMSLNSPMVPLSGSWMTDDLNALDPSGLQIQSE